MRRLRLILPSRPPELARPGRCEAEAEDYKRASALYGEFLKANPANPQAARARATQAALDRLLSLQTELERVQQGDELPRLKRDLSDRQSEVDRLKAEIAKLRADLERLRNIDLQELRAGPKK